MADRNIDKIKLKRSNVPGKIPTTGQLELGEVALNTADAKMYTEYTGGATGATEVREIGWDRVNITGDTMTGNLIAPSFSATTFTGGSFIGDGSGLTGVTDSYVTGSTLNGTILELERNNGLSTLTTELSGLTGSLSSNNLLDIYEAGTTLATSTTYVDIPWDTTVILGSNYSYTGAEITINVNGIYEVTYSLSIDVASGNRKSSRSRLVLDTGGGYNEVVRSASYGYHRNITNGENTSTKTIKIQLNSGDKLKAQFNVLSGGGNLTTISNDSNITITKLV